ncbi:hypothetical protein IAR50_007531 [Cryptococcus sp. DSM 104548]
MPDLLTPQVLATAGPLVLDTFIKHYLGNNSSKDKNKDKAREDLMYDEAFVLMKTFLEMSTKHPVAALQRFGQVRTPSPPWVAVHRIHVPHPTLASAAEYLIKGFGGEEMAFKIAGGTKWWQVRAGPGVEAEWIVMKKDWRTVVAEEKKERKERKDKPEKGKSKEEDKEEDDFRPEMDRLRCMLYIHGGAYYWGSINTHRYTIWRHARKMHGRCFAVNYRKAPQYPFPCALQDCLAAYLYLTNPPPDAPHTAIDPKNIVLAGDSAGGGLCLALLQVLRDTPGLELPAGAVLISPWSDLTHSFPSILENTATDVIPPYGFIHKPSSLWPPPPPVLTDAVQSRLRTKMREAIIRVREHENAGKAPHEGDAAEGNRLKKILSRVSSHQGDKEVRASSPTDIHSPRDSEARGSPDPKDLQPTAEGSDAAAHPEPQHPLSDSAANPASLFPRISLSTKSGQPKTLALDEIPLELRVKGEKVVLDTQIQLYATNSQLNHPWVSPVLGYLGGLPPLYIMAGDNEVLRDENIYLAHKAANPQAYPLRPDLCPLLPSLQGIESRYGPTNVHLQIYDGVCHDLPLFSMTKAARGCFRAIASFARYVTPSAPGSHYIGRTPAGSKPPSRGGTGDTADGLEAGSKPVFGQGVAASPEKLNPQLPETGLAAPSTLTLNSSMRPLAPSTSKGSTTSLLSSVSSTSTPMTANFTGMTHADESVSTEQDTFYTPMEGNFEGMEMLKTEEELEKERGILPPTRSKSLFSDTPSGTPGTRGSTEISKLPSRLDSLDPNHPHPIISPDDQPSTPRPSTPSTPITPATPATPATPGSTEKITRKHRSLAWLQGSGSESRKGSRESRSEKGGEKEKDFHGLDDSRAKEGEAGWPGMYRGENPFGPDHMIRERIDPLGHTRPLSPVSAIPALQIPSEKIGLIKEGPAMRYINGQTLWDKKYKKVGERVEKKRRRNLNEAKKVAERGGEDRGFEGVVREVMKAEKEKSVQGKANKGKTKKKVAGDGDEAWESEAEEGENGDSSWSWDWALQGEAPPPSAIVSRRDFAEARQLALMADRIDSSVSHSTPFHGLNIWVGLAGLFGGSGNEKEKTKEMLQELKEEREKEKNEEKMGKGTENGQGHVKGGKGKWWKFGRH